MSKMLCMKKLGLVIMVGGRRRGITGDGIVAR
jgi:hypothetical protein